MTIPEPLSAGFLQDLYSSKPSAVSQPVLQLLGFESSEHNPKEITVRLSDGNTFFDAALIGPYELANNKIRVSPFTAYHGTMQFVRFDVVRVVDFFSKIDPTKICRLKMMIRKIVQLRASDKKMGRPQELAFYMQVNNLVSDSDVVIQSPPDEPPPSLPPANQVEIKIYEDDPRPPQNSLGGSGVRQEQRVSVNKEMQILGISKDRNPDEPLTLREIMNGYDGFFIGRLLRMKQGVKEGKQGSIHMLSLGFIDSAGEMLKLNLLGKMAVREEKELRKGRCYYLKGLQVVQMKGSCYIKLREKDYKLHALAEQAITAKYPEEYYHWEHEHDYIQNENVDVVGVIEDIQEKTFYGIKNVGQLKEAKEVIRVVIRNKFKTVKVSFWSDQLKNLLRFNLKKGEVIFLEDVRKKKIVFLDYSTESTLTKLDPNSQLYLKLQQYLPQQVEYAKPINIQALYSIQSFEKFNTKVHFIYAYLARIHDEKMLFKYCDLCKKKININSPKCFECKGNVVSLKYNTNVEFGDYSGSLLLAVYDNVAEKLFGQSALAMKQLKENREEYDSFMEKLSYHPFLIGVEIKSERFILRTVQTLKDEDIKLWCQESIRNIYKMQEKTSD